MWVRHGPGGPPARNRLLAELCDCDHIALLDEDDHAPTRSGWLDPYVAALDAGVVGVVWRLGDASGEIVHRPGPIVWRPGLGCPLIVMTRAAYERVGAWNHAAFGNRYGCDDAEWGVRAYRAGLIGPYRGLWPGIDDHGLSIVDLPHPPSSDGKSAEQRHADVAVNVGLLADAIAGRTPIWLLTPEGD